jgi:hypothetical protein
MPLLTRGHWESNTKETTMNLTIDQFTQHLHAQDAAIFVLVMIVVIVVAIWDARNQDKNGDK